MSAPVEENIRQTLRKNGYPDKVVRLPFKPVYESCKQHGTSLAEVLKNLEGENIFGKIQENHIVFRSPDKPEPQAESANDESPGPGSLFGNLGSFSDLQKMAQEQMAKLNPDQLNEIKNRVANMSDEEKKEILKKFTDKFRPK